MLLLLLGGCLLLPGSEALKGPKEVSGFEGDSVSFQCSYKEELKQHQKYWCKEVGLFLSRCSRTIYSGEDGQEVTSGKVSIRDNLRELAFTVTLRNLTLEDRGKYWCGVKRLGTDDTFKVSLVVFPGSSHLTMQLDPTSAKGTSPSPISSSRSRVSVPLVRILAPVLVLLGLLLAAGLVAVGSCVLRRREVHVAMETEKHQKAHLSPMVMKEVPGSHCVPEHAVINLSGTSRPTGRCATLEPSSPLDTEICCQSQTSGEEEVPSQDHQEDSIQGPLHPSPGEKLYFSEFIPV